MEFIMTHKIKFLIAIGILLIIVSILWAPKEEELPLELFPIQDEIEETKVQYIYVDIKGEVKHPGVYKIVYPARLFQAVELAGGFTQDANDLAVNLARYISDQEAVYIPNISEDYPVISHPTNDDEEPSQMININTATQSELEELNGVGPSTAEAIITYREEHGAFSTIEELLNVPGIGEATLEDLAPFIVV